MDLLDSYPSEIPESVLDRLTAKGTIAKGDLRYANIYIHVDQLNKHLDAWGAVSLDYVPIPSIGEQINVVGNDEGKRFSGTVIRVVHNSIVNNDGKKSTMYHVAFVTVQKP